MTPSLTDRRRRGAGFLRLPIVLIGLIGSVACVQAQTLAQIPATLPDAGAPAGVGGGPATTAPMAGAVPGVITLDPNGAYGQRNPDAIGRGQTLYRNAEGQTVLVGSKPRAESPPTEFESYVRRITQLPTIRRFGAELVTPGVGEDAAPGYSALVPPDYIIQAGDELHVTIWGSVDADLPVVVDRAGRVALPRIGSIMVAGVRFGDVTQTISDRIGTVFKNYHLSVSMGRLRGVRVFVTGFVRGPGAVAVTALSTITSALLQAGGPSSAGSLRDIELLRQGKVVSKLDLYQLLLAGNRSADQLVLPDDVIRVAAVGSQVALVGSVNRPAIYELKSGETISDLLAMAGGFSAVADRTRLTIERLDQRATVHTVQLQLPGDQGAALEDGDVLRALSAVDRILPVGPQNKLVHVEGEVNRPGDYLLPAGSTLADALHIAGGLTDNAYLYGTEFDRESVRETQQQNYERALNDLETDFTRFTSTRSIGSQGDAATLAAQTSETNRLITRLKALKPSGRVVLQLTPASNSLPPLTLETGDRIYIPARPMTVGVFGSVFNPGSYLYTDARDLKGYLNLAGGPTRGADKASVFVIRANGTVVSSLQTSSWFGSANDAFWDTHAEPGDTIYMPEELNKTTLVQGFKDWTQILYQFGLGVAGLKLVGF